MTTAPRAGGRGGPRRPAPAMERNLPSKVEQIIPESALYKKLQESERAIDALLMRKKLEIQETLAKPIKKRATLRIFVSNYAADQHHMPPSGPGEPVPHWTLRIEGRVLDHPADAAPKDPNAPPPPKFSHFVKSLVIELDRDPTLYAEPSVIEYVKVDGQEQQPQDGFEVKRRGDADVKCKITIRMDYGPDKLKIAKELAAVVGFDLGGPSKVGLDQLMSKSQVVLALWRYIKHCNLLDQEDKRIVHCDEKLKTLFGSDTVQFPQIPDLVTRWLYPADPIVIHHTIRVDAEYTPPKCAYDIAIEIDDHATKQTLHSLVQALENNREIAELDAQIAAAIVSLNNHRLKRGFMRALAKDPVAFINKYLASQSRDLETIHAGSASGGVVNREETRRADFYSTPKMRDAVASYLATKYRATT